jgi:hypothetical protein
MGSWENATYVKYSNATKLKNVLLDSLYGFGFEEASAPRLQAVSSMMTENWYNDVLASPHLLVGFSAMNPQWIKLKCYPHYLMCADLEGTILLEDVCKRLKCDAIHVNIYDGEAIAAMSVNKEGQSTINGTTYDSMDHLWSTHGEDMNSMTRNVELPFHGSMRVFKTLEACFDSPKEFRSFRFDFCGTAITDLELTLFEKEPGDECPDPEAPELIANIDGLWHFAGVQ